MIGTFFTETFDPRTDRRIMTDDDFPIRGTYDDAVATMIGYVRAGQNHWTYTGADGTIQHIRLTEAGSF